ncbi:tetratricopeptide repeat protein [Kribbella sp. NBC_01505]|uniref:AfsR/SARP family transcriptional regulator n=1 Tax=Kribbella sp. NBC_01505 TaxID=2903580 RepID=UPI003868A1A9
MRYRVLGALEVWRDEEPLAVGGPQQQALLAILLLNANRVVSADRLIEYLWGSHPPTTARSLLQGCISQLRRALQPAAGAASDHPLSTRAPGYRLRVRSAELDLLAFEERVQAAAEIEDPARRSRMLADAIACWSGPVLDGLDLLACHQEIAQLTERRGFAYEQKFEADLMLGVQAGLVAELKAQIRGEPLRERLWGLLIATLYALDRQADALAAYRRLRTSLIDQLGIEPSPTLQELHRQVLAGTPPQDLVIPVGSRSAKDGRDALATAPPAQLPAAPPTFVGRRTALGLLGELHRAEAARMAVAVVSGSPGIGKTALVLQWAHQAKSDFPAGQLYVDLRGYGPASRLRPIEALAGFLAALGVSPERIPVDLEQAAALYRSVLSGKRMLIVLDNAYDAEQVRPLLPASPDCFVLITGRGRLDGLVVRDGGRRFALDVLASDEAVELLREVVGSARVDAEPVAAAELVKLCVRLPLALQITAANLVRRPLRCLADQVRDLRAGTLDALAIGDDDQSAVRAVFARSYESLDLEARRVFCLLGLVPGPGFDTAATAALAALPHRVARASLDRLVSAHLLDESAPDRFAFHDLLRLYACEQAELNDGAADYDLARGRYLRWMVEMADDATRVLCPELLRAVPAGRSAERHQNPESALRWLDTERANLVAIATQTASRGNCASVWLLADALRGYFWLRRHSVDWLAVANAGRSAAETEQNLQAQAAMQFSLGMARLCLNQHAEAIGHQTRALELCEAADWEEGCANALGNLGVLRFEIGELETALSLHEQALLMNGRTGSKRGEAANRCNLAQVHLAAGRLREAGRELWQNLILHYEGDYGRGSTLEQLGVVFGRRGQFEHAFDSLDRALEHFRRVGNLNGEAMTLGDLAFLRGQSGATEDGLRDALRGYEIVRRTGDRVTEAHVLIRLAGIQVDLGRQPDAVTHLEQALDLARQTGAKLQEVEALVGLSAAFAVSGGHDRALDHARRAMVLADDLGYQSLYGQAMATIATIHRELGQDNQHLNYARRAFAVAEASGDELLRRRAVRLLGTDGIGSRNGA